MRGTKSRQSKLDDEGDLGAPIGSREWAVAVTHRLKCKISDLSSDAKAVGMFIATAKRGKAWEAFGYATFGMYCHKELDIEEDAAEAFTKAKKGQTVGVVLGKQGRPKKGEEKGDNITFNRGTEASYLHARIDRDREAGKHDIHVEDFPSVRQAAIAAGIVKVKTPAQQAMHWLRKCSPDEWNIVVEWMNNQ